MAHIIFGTFFHCSRSSNSRISSKHNISICLSPVSPIVFFLLYYLICMCFISLSTSKLLKYRMYYIPIENTVVLANILKTSLIQRFRFVVLVLNTFHSGCNFTEKQFFFYKIIMFRQKYLS